MLESIFLSFGRGIGRCGAFLDFDFVLDFDCGLGLGLGLGLDADDCELDATILSIFNCCGMLGFFRECLSLFANRTDWELFSRLGLFLDANFGFGSGFVRLDTTDLDVCNTGFPAP